MPLGCGTADHLVFKCVICPPCVTVARGVKMMADLTAKVKPVAPDRVKEVPKAKPGFSEDLKVAIDGATSPEEIIAALEMAIEEAGAAGERVR